MIGAIIGDMVGSIYEFDNIKTKDFPFFSPKSHFTDDTVMTIAVCAALLNIKEYNEDSVKDNVIKAMKDFGRRFNKVGYGPKFKEWIEGEDTVPYHSFGNGSAMRVSSAGWLFTTIEETRRVARWTAEVTHNHIEGIKGAEAVASAIYLARTSHTRDDIKRYIVENFGYDLNREIDVIRMDYSFDVSCQGSVPEAILCFLESKSFEDCIRNAVSIGGDSDTIAAIAGSIARAFYDVPVLFEVEAKSRLDPVMVTVLDRFNARIHHSDPFFVFNAPVEARIKEFIKEKNQENFVAVVENLRYTMNHMGHILVPTQKVKKDNKEALMFKRLKMNNGKFYYAAFLDNTHIDKKKDQMMISTFTIHFLDNCLKNKEVEGIVINPWSDGFVLSKEVISEMFKANQKAMERAKVN